MATRAEWQVSDEQRISRAAVGTRLERAAGALGKQLSAHNAAAAPAASTGSPMNTTAQLGVKRRSTDITKGD